MPRSLSSPLGCVFLFSFLAILTVAAEVQAGATDQLTATSRFGSSLSDFSSRYVDGVGDQRCSIVAELREGRTPSRQPRAAVPGEPVPGEPIEWTEEEVRRPKPPSEPAKDVPGADPPGNARTRGHRGQERIDVPIQGRPKPGDRPTAEPRPPTPAPSPAPEPAAPRRQLPAEHGR